MEEEAVQIITIAVAILKVVAAEEELISKQQIAAGCFQAGKVQLSFHTNLAIQIYNKLSNIIHELYQIFQEKAFAIFCKFFYLLYPFYSHWP